MNNLQFKFYGLGSFYFEYKDKKINGSSWVSKRALYLLMYLLVKDKHIPAEKLIDIFWQESDVENGKNKLYNTVYLLRKSIAKDGMPKDLIKSEAGGYRINNQYDIWRDWYYFEKKSNYLIQQEKTSITKFKKLIELYRGNLFASLRYDSWPDGHRERLKGNYLTIIETLSEKLFLKQKYRDAISYLRKGIEADPYRENFYLIYIKSLVKLGRIVEGSKIYKDYEKLLKEELDLSPSLRLQNEYQKIKSQGNSGVETVSEFSFNSIKTKGALICDFEVFKQIYELESRHVRRRDQSFILITIDFNKTNLNNSLSKITKKAAEKLRSCDAISTYNKKMYLILRDINLVNSGVIMKHFNQFYKELKLKPKPTIDIKEISGSE